MQMDELKHGVELAVNQCGQAAVHEFDVVRQQLLLKVAQQLLKQPETFWYPHDNFRLLHMAKLLPMVWNQIRL